MNSTIEMIEAIKSAEHWMETVARSYSHSIVSVLNIRGSFYIKVAEYGPSNNGQPDCEYSLRIKNGKVEEVLDQFEEETK